jgi:two-component system KDP operon response regulator KdpE
MTANLSRVLVIEDDPSIRRFLRISLSIHNYRIIEANTGAEGLALMSKEQPELVVLDLGLSDMDGLEVLGAIRAASRTPVVVLSARADEKSKVHALEVGADDYVTKPFGMAELIARLRTAQRHAFYAKGEEPIFRNGDMIFDAIHRRVTRAGCEVKLSPIEFGILQFLVAYAGKVLTHQQIIRQVWGSDQDVQYLRTYVGLLRKKIEQDPRSPKQILTEAGVGYRLQLCDEGQSGIVAMADRAN